MSYEPTNWKDGDLVTSAKLNKMEQGIANGVLVVGCTRTEDTITLDKTWKQIYDADYAVCVEKVEENDYMGSYYCPILGVTATPDGYWLLIDIADSITQFDAATENDYPTSSGQK